MPRHLRITRGALASALVPLLAATAAPAQDSAAARAPAPPARDTVAAAQVLPITPVRTLSFTTDEATWVSLDVSPDGRTIVFDVLGDLYTIPIGGGQARRITSGMAWDCMPRWSPDGRTIAFISDRAGSDNLWVANADGSGARQVTKETDFALSSPVWTPDGNYLVVRKFGAYPGPVDYLRSIPLWIYHKEGGAGTEIYPNQTGRLTSNSGAAVSPDGRTLYFSSHAGGYQGTDLGRFQLVALDRMTGEQRTLTSRYGGALRPIVSPDGRWLVYATRADAKTALRIRDLRTQEDRWLVAEMQRDDQEGYAPNDVLPGYGFTPDSRAVVFTGGGKIQRVDLDTRRVSTIPFEAHVELGMGRRLEVPLRLSDGPLAVRQIVGVSESPDRSRLAFGAVGKVWIADVRGGAVGTPRRLTRGGEREYAPAISPDGRWVAYVSWSDSIGGTVWKARSDGSGAPVALTRMAGFYSAPTWSPEGDRMVYLAGSTQAGLGASPISASGELRWVPASGCAAATPECGRSIVRTTTGPALVTSDRAGTGRVYYVDAPTQSFDGTTPTYVVNSVRYDGTDRRVHAKLTSTNSGPFSVLVSPTERAMLVLDRDDIYVLPFTDVGRDGLAVNLQAPSVPVRRLTTEGANYAAWADSGRTIAWSFVNHYSRASFDTVMRYADASRWRPERLAIALEVPRATPRGATLLRGARIVTMRGDEVLEKGDILIEDARIAQVGASLTAPAGAKVIDVAGTTIIPGIVDVHAHPQTGREIAPDAEWSSAANLAFGVTSTRNPSTPRGTFAWEELVETGGMVGPRLFATGTPLTSTNAVVKSYDDALHVVRRYKEQGANSLKQYLQPRRIQRQWILQAALAEGINSTNEGASDIKADLSMAIDGYTAVEHSLNVVPIYKDVITVFADTKATYTPTLVVAYGGPEGDDYWRARTDLHADAKVRRFTPHDALDRKVRRRPLIVDEDYNFPLIARGARDIMRAGGRVGLGSHGQQDGIGAHWELWMLAMGGMTPMEALRIATLYGAESIGYGRDLGSIEPGKLADLVVLERNPLEDIRNSTSIRYVVKNGEIREGATLDRVWPEPRKYPTSYWRADDAALERIRP